MPYYLFYSKTTHDRSKAAIDAAGHTPERGSPNDPEPEYGAWVGIILDGFSLEVRKVTATRASHDPERQEDEELVAYLEQKQHAVWITFQNGQFQDDNLHLLARLEIGKLTPADFKDFASQNANSPQHFMELYGLHCDGPDGRDDDDDNGRE